MENSFVSNNIYPKEPILKYENFSKIDTIFLVKNIY